MGEDTSAEEYCDVSQFDVFEPLWVVEEADSDYVSAVRLADSAVFVSGRLGDGRFLERRTLTGEQTWRVDAPLLSDVVEVDATHFYYLDSTGDLLHRRALVDGALDDSWWVAAPDMWVTKVQPADDELMLGGLRDTEAGVGAPSNARFAHVSKTEPNTLLQDSEEFGELGKHNSPQAILARSSGGWLVNVATSDGDYTQIVSLGGPAELAVNATFSVTPFFRATSIHEVAEGLLLLGTERAVWHGLSWAIGTDAQGAELWRKPISPCGPDIDALISGAVEGSDGLWLMAQVALDEDVTDLGRSEPVLVQLSLEGDIQHVWRFEPPNAESHWYVSDFDGDGDTMVLSFTSDDADWVSRPYVARLR